MDLVANRECGKCTVCCKVPMIDHPQLQKLPGVACPNCKIGGCKIYETRPEPCRGFFCGWRYMADLGNDWRPDKNGILIRFETAPPGGYPPTAFQFLVFGGSDVVRPALIDFMMQLIGRRVAVFLALRGPDGYSDVKVFVNDYMKEAVAKRDRNTFVKFVRDALTEMSKNKFERAVFTHGTPAAPAAPA